MAKKEKKKKRDFSLDMLRGLAILTMVFSHSIYFFHNDSNKVLLLLREAANTITFTTFLFVSASVLYISYLKKSEGKRLKLLKKAFTLLCVYYLLAFVGNIKNLNISRTILLLDIYSFTEFLLPLIFYPVILTLFWHISKKIAGNLALAIVISILTFAAGMYLSTINTGTLIDHYLYIIGGHDGVYLFPLLQYFSVVIAGLSWGKFIDERSNSNKIIKISTVVFTIILAILLLSISLLQNIEISVLIKRWPPTVLFILIGLSFVFLIITLTKSKLQPEKNSFVFKFFNFLSLNSIYIYTFHTIIILLYGNFYDRKTSNIFIVILLYILLLGISSLLSITWNKLKQKYEKGHLFKI